MSPIRISNPLTMRVTDALYVTGLCASLAEARREIKYGTVKINEDVVTNDRMVAYGDLIRVGSSKATVFRIVEETP